jgi:hypothetical protein
LAGNNYNTEVESARLDAALGVLMTGDGMGNFTPVPARISGFFADGDVRDMARISMGGQDFVLVSQNDGVLKIFGY